MSVRVSATEGPQWGRETTKGTGVPANYRLLAFDRFMIDPVEPINTHQSAGSEIPLETSRQKVHSTWQGDGVACYRTLPFLLSSLLKQDNASPYAFEADPFGVETIDAYTIETGSGVRADKAAYGICAALRLRATRQEVSMTASGFGRKLQQNVVKTAAPTNVVPVPFDPDRFQVLLGSTFGGQALAKHQVAELNVSGRWAPHFSQNTLTDSFDEHKKMRVTAELGLTLEYQADAEYLLGALRTKEVVYVTLSCLSQLEFSAGSPYDSQCQLACKVVRAPARSEDDGVIVGQFGIQPIYDANLGAAGSWIDWVITNGFNI